MNETNKKFDEVVGILNKDNVIRSGRPAITTTLSDKGYKKLITRFEAEFMAKCDLGLHWQKLSEMPTLFLLSDA